MAADWAARAADTVDLVVDTIYDKLIRPAVLAARLVIFGIIVLILALVVILVVSVALVRLLDVYAFGDRVWASDALIGSVLTAGGLFAWWRSSHKSRASDG